MDTQTGSADHDTEQTQAEITESVAPTKQYSVYFSRYYTVIGLLLILAALILAGAFVVPVLQETLVALSAVAIFAALLLYLVTPERFLPASSTRSMESVTSRNIETVVSRLNVCKRSRYVPTESGVMLFFPELANDPTPSAAEIEAIASGDSESAALVLEPTAQELIAAIRSEIDELSGDTHVGIRILSAALTDKFGLADSVTVDSIDETHATVRITGSIFDSKSLVDHPIQSFFAVGLAHILNQPVRPTMTDAEDNILLLTLRWGDPPESYTL